MTKHIEPKLSAILPPDIMADIGTVLSSGLSDESVARNLEAVLNTQKDRLAKRGYSSGIITQELLKNRKARS